MTTTKSSRYFQVYQRRRQELLGLAREQQRLVRELRMDEAAEDGPKPEAVLAGIIDRLELERLRVLVIGRFNAGKSTFINALFGEAMLPSSPNPTTGVLCEIKYAEESAKKARLFPKPKMGRNGGSDPFDVDRISSLHDELARYVKIDHFGDSEATSRYKKLELYWPLPLCKDGVELVDSVGLDDPDARDYITLEYAKSADAILYCMKSQDVYTARDKQVLNLLKTLGYQSIFFVITHYDHIRESIQMGETTEEEFKRLQVRNLAPWSELKERGIKYVDSKAALIGRIKGRKEAVADSGIEDLESSLEVFLAEEKGKAKLLTSLRSLRAINRSVSGIIPYRIAMWQTPNAKLEQRYKEAEPRLRTLEHTRTLMVKGVERAIRDIGWQARDRAEEYFLGMRERIKSWALEYEIQTGFGFPPEVKPVVTEVVEHIKGKIEQSVGEWTQGVLLPLVQTQVHAVEESLAGRAREFFETADQIRIDLSAGAELNPDEVAESQKPSTAGRVAAGVYTILTGDFLTGGAGMFLGLKAMMNTIVLQIIGGILLAIFGMLNPVGIILVALGAIGGGAAMNIFQLKKTIKTKVGEKLGDIFDSRRRELGDAVRSEIEKQLLGLRTSLDENLAGEIASVRGEVEKIIEERRQGEADATRKISDLRAQQQANAAIEEKLDTLLEEAGIGRAA